MSEEKQVVKYGMDREIKVTEEQMGVIKRTIFPNSTDDELKLFIFECVRRGVHPMDRKIFPVKYAAKEGDEEKRVTFITSIDMFRSEAQETGEFAGIDEPEYGEVHAQGYPQSAKVTVYRWVTAPTGEVEKVAFSATARWSEFFPGEKKGFMWKTKPFLMLGKCAEAQAFRKAFPRKLSGLYVPEEMEKTSLNGSGDKSIAGSIEQKQAPAGTAAKGPAGTGSGPTAKKPPVKVQFKQELEEYCRRTGKQPAEALKEITSFEKQGGGTAFANSIEKMSDAWAGKALAKLREIMPPKPPAGPDMQPPLGCTKDPQTCSESSWEDHGGGDLRAICSTKQECPFPLPE